MISLHAKRVLVTGAAGFIGRRVSEELRRGGAFVVGIDRNPDMAAAGGPVLACDLLDRARLIETLHNAAPDAIVHLAARTDLDEKAGISGYAANIEGVANLIDATRATPTVKRCLYTSTQLVCRVGYVPRDEADYCPNTLYGQSKVQGEEIVRRADGGGVEWCLLRPTTVWGPGMSAHYRRFFGYVRAGRYFHVGGRALHKSYGYIGNIAYQYRRFLEAPAAAINRRVFYLADYEPIDLVAWIDAFRRALDAKPIPTLPIPVARVLAWAGDLAGMAGVRRVPFNSFRLRNILTEYRFDPAPTEAVCGPLPYTTAQGVSETVAWLRNLD